jgi:hypothetical protein
MLHNKERTRMLKNSKWIIAVFVFVAIGTSLFFNIEKSSQNNAAGLSQNTTSISEVIVEAVPEGEDTVVYDEDFEDFTHYDHIEGYNEVFEDEDNLAHKEDVVDRIVSSAGDEVQIVKKIEKIADDKWGTLEIELIEEDHPAYAPLEMKIFVTCKDQVKMIKQRPPPKRELLLKSLRMCEYRGHDFNKNTHMLKIKYLLQSPDAAPNEPVCNEIWDQNFSIEEACSKWKYSN